MELGEASWCRQRRSRIYVDGDCRSVALRGVCSGGAAPNCASGVGVPKRISRRYMTASGSNRISPEPRKLPGIFWGVIALKIGLLEGRKEGRSCDVGGCMPGQIRDLAAVRALQRAKVAHIQRLKEMRRMRRHTERHHSCLRTELLEFQRAKALVAVDRKQAMRSNYCPGPACGDQCAVATRFHGYLSSSRSR